MSPENVKGQESASPVSPGQQAPLPLSLVVAVAENGVIGRGNALPWHLSSDLKRFRDITWGKPLLMGRRTYESIGKPLPGRISIVLSTDPDLHLPEGAVKAATLEEGLVAAAEAARTLGARDIMVIGGRRIFAETLPLAQTLYFTRVHAAPEGDVLFPQFDATQWRETGREGPVQGPKDDAAFTLHILTRI